jgi:REP element-mobilizing transposase RayT
MSPPRPVFPGKTYLVTRRCSQREFLLRPSPTANAVYLYLLAVAARRHGILVHGYCVMSNHVHLVITDPDGCLPKFKQYLNSLVARAMNVALRRSEAFWASNVKYSAVSLESPSDVLEKAVYVLANPVAAGLVASGREWPGAWSAPELLGSGSILLHRPSFFFRKKGPMPETAELELTAPPGFGSNDEFRIMLAEALASRESDIQASMTAEDREFLGRRAVLAQRTSARPSTREEFGALHPAVASRDKWKRIEALAQLVAFRREYRIALAKLRGGVRDVVFPRGTYWLRIAHGVRCEAAA